MNELQASDIPGEEDPRRLAAALGYLFTPVVPLINLTGRNPDDRWMRYHAVQGLLWSGPFIVLLIISVLLVVFMARSNVLFICLLPLMTAIPFIPGAIWARKIYLGDEVSIPIIGEQVSRSSNR